MKILVSVDMEGVAGVVSPDDITPDKPEYERNRMYMTDEASAAVRGILTYEPQATVVVCDAHAKYRNILPDRLARGCTLLRGAPRMHGMMAGIDEDEDVDAVVFIGYHGMAGTAQSVLAHTISGGTIARVRCNGQELGEVGLNAALASFYSAVPALAVGDDTLVHEAEAVVPGIATVSVKQAFGNRAAQSLHPADSCAAIEAAVPNALANRSNVNAPRFAGAVDLEVDMLRPYMTEMARLIPGIEMRGALTLAIRTTDFPTAYNLIDVMAVLGAFS